jgi:flagellar biogenesis protein FliO
MVMGMLAFVALVVCLIWLMVHRRMRLQKAKDHDILRGKQEK